MNPVAVRIIRAYFSKVPDHPGKWKLWTMINPHLRSGYFEAGGYPTSLGFEMLLTPDQYIDRFIYYWGLWEPDETQFISSILRSGDRFIDIGANAGYFTLLAARIVGARGRVEAFEPVPPTVQRLRHNVARNGFRNVQIHECATSREEGSVFIHQHGIGEVSGQNSMRVGTERSGGWEVSTRRIDHVISNTPPIRLMKMDIEGAELLALSGASGILAGKEAPIVLCEVTDSYLRQLSGSAEELYALMASYGYDYVYDCHNVSLTRLSPAEQSRHVTQRNVVFAKQPL